jgi:hypothetical protein
MRTGTAMGWEDDLGLQELEKEAIAFSSSKEFGLGLRRLARAI